MRTLAILAAVMLAGCAAHEHRATVRLTFDDGGCSGTIIGHHTILTATHCFEGAHTLAIDGKPVQILSLTPDGHDHTLARVSATFQHVAKRGQMPQVGERIHLWGNPGQLIDLYRSGEVYGNAVLDGKDSTLVGINGWMGDSGAGLFDAEGRLVGVISFVFVMDSGPRWQAMGVYALNFTPEQWEAVQ